MAVLLDRDLTLPEAAFVADVSERVINQEIEASVVRPRKVRTQRRLRTEDVVYLTWVRNIRADINPKLRKRFRAAIATAMEERKTAATIESLHLRVDQVVREVRNRLKQLEASHEKFIEQRPEVLGGEPVLKGTRISAHFIADLIKRGMNREEIAEELELEAEQIEAAELFARVTPKRGRPRRKRHRVTEHVPAHR